MDRSRSVIFLVRIITAFGAASLSRLVGVPHTRHDLVISVAGVLKRQMTISVVFSSLYAVPYMPSQCGATAERRNRYREFRVRNSLVPSVFPLSKEINRYC